LTGQKAHADPVQLGTDNAFYIENSEFFTNVWQGGQNIGDGTGGQRVVIRRNLDRGSMIENHGACSGQSRGTYWLEIYENDIYPQDWNGSSGYQYSGIKTRGGTGVIYNNRFYGSWDSSSGEIHLDAQREATFVAPDCGSPVNVPCTSGSNIDTVVAGRPAGTTGGRLCLDQIGGGTGAIGSQTEDPFYVWGNVNKGSGGGNTPISYRIVPYPGGSGNSPIIGGRDVLSGQKPGYTPLQYPHPLRGVWGDSIVRPPVRR
jgi:hypothetical protein